MASGTRHNIGFEVLDEVAKQKEVRFETLDFAWSLGLGFLGTQLTIGLRT